MTIFAAGNDYNLNNPDAMAGLGYFVPDIAPNWLTVAALQQNPDAAAAATTPYSKLGGMLLGYPDSVDVLGDRHGLYCLL